MDLEINTEKLILFLYSFDMYRCAYFWKVVDLRFPLLLPLPYVEMDIPCYTVGSDIP